MAIASVSQFSSQKNLSPEDKARETRASRLRAFIRMHGFNPDGRYTYIPESGTTDNISSNNGEIYNGSIRGNYQIDNFGTITITKGTLGLSKKYWRRLLTMFDPNLAFIRPDEVESIELDLGSIKFNVAINTPKNEDKDLD